MMRLIRERAAVRGSIYLILTLLCAVHAVTAWSLEDTAISSESVPAPTDSQILEPLVMGLKLNGETSADVLLQRDAQGQYWMELTHFEQLRLLPPMERLQHDGQEHALLNAIPNISLALQETASLLEVTVPAPAFMTSSFTVPSTKPYGRPDVAARGVLLDYQLSLQNNSDYFSGGLYKQLTLFNAGGVFETTAATRYLPEGWRGLRIESTFRRDNLETLRSLRLGDAITVPGSWGSAARFAGVQWGRNFSLRPDLVTSPLLSAGGSAIVPSTVDVLVNGQRVLVEQVPAGPFTIQDIPAITGEGQVQLLVRDALGREQVITQPFYASPNLLAKGFSTYSVELGKIRQRFLQRSFDYGPVVASAAFGRGISDSLTLEAHAEMQAHDAWAAGGSLAARWGRFGILGSHLALGGGDGRKGWQAGSTFVRETTRYNFGLSAAVASSGYRQIEHAQGLAAWKFRGLASGGLPLGRAGNLSLAWAYRQYHTRPTEQDLTLAYNYRTSDKGFLNFSLTRSASERKTISAFLNFTRSLGIRRSTSATIERIEDRGRSRQRARVSAMESLPIGEGQGWQASVSQDGDFQGIWQRNFKRAQLEVQAARSFGFSGQSLTVNGGLVSMGGIVRGMRSTTGSFALVEVAELPDVAVYVENQEVARTDSQGRALLHNLLPYEENRITIEPLEIPLDVAIHRRSMLVRPAYRSGVALRFPVERVRSGVVTLLLESGLPVPAGASVSFHDELFTVAYDGYTYLTGIDRAGKALVTWGDGRCEVEWAAVSAQEVMFDAGEKQCRSLPLESDASQEPQ